MTLMKNAVSFKCECKEGTSGARCEYVEGNMNKFRMNFYPRMMNNSLTG